METAQELARVAFFAALSAVVAFAANKLAGMNQSETIVIVGTLVLKMVDGYIHENPKIKSNGLTDTNNLKILK